MPNVFANLFEIEWLARLGSGWPGSAQFGSAQLNAKFNAKFIC